MKNEIKLKHKTMIENNWPINKVDSGPAIESGADLTGSVLLCDSHRPIDKFEAIKKP